MPRLSIVIPALGSHELLESGLVSVLEHRPVDSEVLVVLNEPYEDPYDLEGEIRFVHAPPRSDLLDSLNLGHRSSAGDAIHFLGCGFEVSPGWAEGPLKRLADPNVGSVVPLVAQPGSETPRVGAGVAYDRGGRAAWNALRAEAGSPAEFEPLGPVGLAGFYSAAALETLEEIFSPAVGLEWSDVDLALRLRAAGFRTELDSTSRIIGDARMFTGVATGLRRARFAERLYWRHAASLGRVGSLAAHVGLVLSETARSFPRPSSFIQLTGRMLGCIDSLQSTRAAPQSRVSANPRIMPGAQNTTEPHRLDGSHEALQPSLNSSAIRGRKSQARP